MRRVGLTLRVAVVLCLVLAALLLLVDAQEYPGHSRAAFRALGRGALPLLLVAGLNLLALERRRGAWWRGAALAVNVALLALALRLLRSGAPLGFWLLSAVATLLVVSSAAWLWMALRTRAA